MYIKIVMMTGLALIILMGQNLIYGQENPGRNLYTDWNAGDAPKTFKATHGESFTDGEATVTILVEEYLFPVSIDPTGEHIVIVPFGVSGETIYWTSDAGAVVIPGDAKDVNAEGNVGGTFLNENFPGGGVEETAGIYDAIAAQWGFLGMNPEYPSASDEGYNVGWGMSDDGNTVVGMQWHDGWSVTAFKWTEADGYTMIGDLMEYDTRASGISRNGEVIYGWVSSDFGYWRPVIWHDDTYTLVAGDDASGEAMCASPNGNYVAGITDFNAFIWSVDGGLVNFGSDQDFPTSLLDDGSVFGFNTVFPPTLREAFYRDPEGNMMSFNDYAEARGMEDAQQWTFYSINDVTPDGDKFIGAGVNPDGQDVCFLIDFSDEPQYYNLNLVANPAEGGEVIGSGEYEVGQSVTIEAIPADNYVFINWTNQVGDTISSEPVAEITMGEDDMNLTANFQSTVGFSEISAGSFDIYPNPAREKCFVSTPENTETKIRILNIAGSEVFSDMITKNQTEISTSDFAPGLYFVHISTLNSTITRKLIIE
jgi:hypothetical protein